MDTVTQAQLITKFFVKEQFFCGVPQMKLCTLLTCGNIVCILHPRSCMFVYSPTQCAWLLARHLACGGELMVVGTHSLTHLYFLLSGGLRLLQHVNISYTSLVGWTSSNI